MPREQTPLRPIQVDYRCDECSKGYYRPNGNSMLMSSPAKFEHSCDNCGHSQTFTERYPTVRYAREAELLELENYQQQTMN